jgi:hypothetical protein
MMGATLAKPRPLTRTEQLRELYSEIDISVKGDPKEREAFQLRTFEAWRSSREKAEK